MKILHVIPSLEPRYGGPSKVVIEMSIFQKKAKEDVAIVSTHFYTEKAKEIRDIDTMSFPSYLGEFKISLTFFIWMAKNINRYDIIHIHSFFSFSSIVASIFSIIYSKPFIIRPAGQFSSYAIKQKKYVLKKMFILFIGDYLLRKASYIHVTSVGEREESIFRGSKYRYFKLPNWIGKATLIKRDVLDKLFFKLAGKQFILYLGRIHPIKNLELTLQSLARTKSFVNDEKRVFVVAGDGDKEYVKSLKNLSFSLRINEKVIFVGDVRGEKKNALLSNAEIFILLSHMENFGISVLEALAYGLPIIVSEKVGFSKTILASQAGQVVDTDVTSVTKAIDLVLKNKKIASIYSTNGIRLVENQFQWDAITAKQISIYEKVHNVR